MATRTCDVRMRKADSADAPIQLLPELSKPLASLNASRIALWVYRQGTQIREIVLAGHAESRTCSSVSSAIIEAAKQLDGSVEWMLTCGAASFKVKHAPAANPFAGPGGPGFLAGLDGNQRVLDEMVRALSELSDETGLVEVMHRDWEQLKTDRQRGDRRTRADRPTIVLPDPARPPIADYRPIVPHGARRPLVFHLEGWDFDCPAYQAVADRHLRKVRRELLKDALRRRSRYRSWLKEWVERWVHEIKQLTRIEAERIRVDVPGPADRRSDAAAPADPATFFDRLAEFLHPSQQWHREVAYVHREFAFAMTASPELDRKIRPETVNVIDFERGISTQRQATAEDEFTLRDRITRHTPDLVTTCLRYIRRMDAIIQPYEDMRLWQRLGRGRSARQTASTGEQREAACVAEISRRIIIETMIRGWPSFYLDDEADRAAFDAWAEDCRPGVWSVMARQAEAAGVTLDILLEDNVVYDVRFDDDLGCTVQPLMLTDDVSHAQVYASGAGAGVAVPLWPRHTARPMPTEVSALGRSNRQRAAALVDRARRLTDHERDTPGAAEALRLALGCHPGEAGRLILEEWSSRLGRDTSDEFALAGEIVRARELCSRLRFEEARPHLETYLVREPQPAGNALVMAALCELMMRTDARTPVRPAATLVEFKRRTGRFTELRDRLAGEIGCKVDELGPATIEPALRSRPHLRRLLKDLEPLRKRIDELGPQVEQSEQRCREWVNKALNMPGSVKRHYPALARAATEARERLEQLLEHHCRFVPNDQEMTRRYGDVAKVVEMRALFVLMHRLSAIRHRLDTANDRERRAAIKPLNEIADDPWLHENTERDLRGLAEDFDKGGWDRLLTHQIGYRLQEAISVCYTRVQDLLSDLMTNAVPLAEPLATRIHIAQTIDGKYRKAVDMMLEARVALGRAIGQPWKVLETEFLEMPAGGKLGFDPVGGVISLVADGRTTPLLEAPGLANDESQYLAAVVADEGFASRINRFAASLAEGVLAVEVDPPPAWRRWRAVMGQVRTELLAAVAMFSDQASLLPQFAPPLTGRGRQIERQLDEQPPFNEPAVDLKWRDLDTWSDRLGPDPVRIEQDRD